MTSQDVVFLSIPALRPGDITEELTPTLYGWANNGSLAELTPTFPCLTSCVQASMWTGSGPAQHGVIANGFYHRDRSEVEFWVARNEVVGGRQIWDVLNRAGISSAVWHAQNIKDCAADFIVTPAPIHEDDGSTKLWCYSKPVGLYDQLLDELGHFPLQHYWGPLSNIESTRWILKAASWLTRRHAPRFHWIYIPHLDYASQKFGPSSNEAKAALAELDAELAVFSHAVSEGSAGRDTAYVVAGEYAMTGVAGVVYPNRILREAGLLKVDSREGHEYLDICGSAAFAMVDHQLAHIFINGDDTSARERIAAKVADMMRNRPGVAGAYIGDERSALGINHARSGDVVLITDDAHWFAYYWWLDDRLAPPFARTVDIHRKPGYDPVELFLDPATRSIPVNAELVKGSHGVPATQPCHNSALICSTQSPAIKSSKKYADTDLKRICLELLGVMSSEPPTRQPVS